MFVDQTPPATVPSRRTSGVPGRRTPGQTTPLFAGLVREPKLSGSGWESKGRTPGMVDAAGDSIAGRFAPRPGQRPGDTGGSQHARLIGTPLRTHSAGSDSPDAPGISCRRSAARVLTSRLTASAIDHGCPGSPNRRPPLPRRRRGRRLLCPPGTDRPWIPPSTGSDVETALRSSER